MADTIATKTLKYRSKLGNILCSHAGASFKTTDGGDLVEHNRFSLGSECCN